MTTDITLWRLQGLSLAIALQCAPFNSTQISIARLLLIMTFVTIDLNPVQNVRATGYLLVGELSFISRPFPEYKTHPVETKLQLSCSCI